MRHAVQQCRGALDELDALGIVGEHAEVRRHAVHAVEGELAEIALAEREPADVQRVQDAAGRHRHPHRRIERDHLGHGRGLLVLHRLRAEVGDAEGRVDHVGVAEQAHAAAPCERFGRLAARRHADGRQLGRLGGPVGSSFIAEGVCRDQGDTRGERQHRRVRSGSHGSEA
jgi:hypothetical protein